MTRIGIYNENVHEQTKENVRAIYPEGIHGTLASFLKDDDVSIRIFTLDTVEEITDYSIAEIHEDTSIAYGVMLRTIRFPMRLHSV